MKGTAGVACKPTASKENYGWYQGISISKFQAGGKSFDERAVKVNRGGRKDGTEENLRVRIRTVANQLVGNDGDGEYPKQE